MKRASALRSDRPLRVSHLCNPWPVFPLSALLFLCEQQSFPYTPFPVKVLVAITYRHYPPVLRKIYVRCFWVSLAVVTLTVAFVIVRDFQQWPRRPWTVIVPVVGGFAPACIIFPLSWWLRRGIVREWHKARGRLCTHCAYDISTLAAAGTCPECGGAYDANADAATWAKAGLKSP